MPMGPFEAMTALPEFVELLEDWNRETRLRLIRNISRQILDDTDAAQVRRVAKVAGALETLDAFDTYLQKRIDAERQGSGRPLRKELSHEMRHLRRN